MSRGTPRIGTLLERALTVHAAVWEPLQYYFNIIVPRFYNIAIVFILHYVKLESTLLWSRYVYIRARKTGPRVPHRRRGLTAAYVHVSALSSSDSRARHMRYCVLYIYISTRCMYYIVYRPRGDATTFNPFPVASLVFFFCYTRVRYYYYIRVCPAPHALYTSAFIGP